MTTENQDYEVDNVMPNTGEHFLTETTEALNEEEQARQEELQRKLDGLPIIVEMRDHLKIRIDYYKSIDSIPDAAVSDGNQLQIAMAANKQTKFNLEQELRKFEDIILELTPN